ncbi:MAG: DUF3168 domain-containing protein [Vicinamibacteria bacterium]
MLIAEALVSLLTGAAGVAAFTGTRVYPQVVPQTAARPAIAYQRVSSVPEHSHSGFSSLSTTRFQLTLEANTQIQAYQLARAVRQAIDGKTTVVGDITVVTMVENETDGYGETAQVPVVRMDVMMQHNES